MVRARDRRRLAFLLTPVLVALAVAVVVVAGDVPLVRRASAGGSRAAVAVRDHVVPFQKWGTRLFTLPHLESAYDDVTYLTQDGAGDERADLVAALERALAGHDAVDLFLLAHGNRFVDWVADIDPALRGRLRLVYNTGCGGAGQASEWLAAGADVYVGHGAPGSQSPAFYFYFLRRWVRGWRLDEAVDAANRKAVARLGWLGLAERSRDPSAAVFGRADLWLGERGSRWTRR
jgi:hypothetical protein